MLEAQAEEPGARVYLAGLKADLLAPCQLPLPLMDVSVQHWGASPSRSRSLPPLEPAPERQRPQPGAGKPPPAGGARREQAPAGPPTPVRSDRPQSPAEGPAVAEGPQLAGRGRAASQAMAATRRAEDFNSTPGMAAEMRGGTRAMSIVAKANTTTNSSKVKPRPPDGGAGDSRARLMAETRY